MNRQTLLEATSIHDGAVPTYLMDEICNATNASDRDAEKIADFLLNRLNKSSLIVKLKALQILAYCAQEGSETFLEVLREEQKQINAYLQLTGPPDPVYGDERYRRIRVAAQEAMVCINGGTMYHQTEGPKSIRTRASSADRQPNTYARNNFSRSPGYGDSFGMQQQNQNTTSSWGAPLPLGATRPLPYRDTSSSVSSFNNSHSSNVQSPQQIPQQMPQQMLQQTPQNSGLSSWSTPAAVTTPSGTSTSGSGVWSASGYQKKEAPPPAPGPVYSRDNRPTVLVGHNVSFGGRPNNPGHMSGGFQPPPGPPQMFMSSSAQNNSLSSSMRHPGANRNPYGSSSSSSYPARSIGGMTGIGSMGMTNANAILNSNQYKETAAVIKETAKTVTKIGREAKGMWDRRNMDKSMGSSLADHDELSAATNAFDHNGGGMSALNSLTGRASVTADAEGSYERGLIDSLCESAGLARAPPAEGLKRFVELAQTLNAQTIVDIILDKLEDSAWQVRLKALHVVLALIESTPAGEYYMDVFEENIEVLEELMKDTKPSVVAKAKQVLRFMDVLDEADIKSIAAPAAAPKKSKRASAASPQPTPAKDEVDFLGLESLSVQEPAPSVMASVGSVSQASYENDLLGDSFLTPQDTYQQPYQSQQVAPSVNQEMSLLDGFDEPTSTQGNLANLLEHQEIQGNSTVSSTFQQDRSKTLSDFGKDLFTTANSPRNSPQLLPVETMPPTTEKSAFNFM